MSERSRDELWAERRDPDYYEQLAELVKRLHDEPEALPACFPRADSAGWSRGVP